MVRWIPFGALVLLALACGKEPTPIAEPLTDFEKRTSEYTTLRTRLADSLGPVDETKSQAEIAARAAALATAITNARLNAKQGDIFTPEAATVIATMIKDEYTRRSEKVTEDREDHAEEYKSDGLQPFEPKVNQLFPTNYPLPTFDPLLLPLLPKLPEHLEYRRMEHYLMLRDIDANLIVDFMPNAFPK
jgi:hypothetical protein